MGRQRQARWLRRWNAVMTAAWLVMIPLSIVTGWIESVVFISAISLYANVASHLSAWQASRAEESVERSS